MAQPRTTAPARYAKAPSTARRAARSARAVTPSLSAGARRCRAKFLRHFADGFRDETYLDWERDYKWKAHERWETSLGESAFRQLLKDGDHSTIAARAVAIESRTNLLFSFEKMALRDAVKPAAGARNFAHGLFEFLHGAGELTERFEGWCQIVGSLPRRQTRVLTWPVATVFGFLAQPSPSSTSS